MGQYTSHLTGERGKPQGIKAVARGQGQKEEQNVTSYGLRKA